MQSENSALEPPVASPCIRRCCLDDSDICVGCKRTLAEICAWSAADNAEKKRILARCEQRKQRQ